MFKIYETELAGRKLSIESGKIARQANGSVVVRYGETTVMVNVTASKEAQDGVDFFPLSVNYEEKLYAVGRIPEASIEEKENLQIRLYWFQELLTDRLDLYFHMTLEMMFV